MKTSTRLLAPLVSALVIVTCALPRESEATVVEVQTVLGNFEVNLYDNATPITVANFLNYVNNGAYTNSIVHRTVPGFVAQGGGFRFDMSWPAQGIPANAAITNEPVYSNVRGTIAMAKTSQPDSATNQWFINLADNSANLDVQNEGFTVFGEVVGNGMDVVDAIATLPRFNFGSPFGELPLLNDNGGDPDATNLVIVTAVIVTDTTVDSAGVAGLNPTPNTLINQPPVNPPANGGGGGGGGGGATGSVTLFLLLLATLLGSATRRKVD